MLTLPPSVKIYVAIEAVDARKSFDGLAAIVESQFGLTPMSGHLFVFINRRGDQATFNIPIREIHGALPVAPIARTPRAHRASRR